MSIEVLQTQLDTALANLTHERAARERLEASLERQADEHRAALERLADAHRAELGRLADAHRAEMGHQQSQWREKIATRMQSFEETLGESLRHTAAHQKCHKREKGTTAPAPELEHYCMLTKFGQEDASQDGNILIRCTSGQHLYCEREERRLTSSGDQVMENRLTEKGIDICRYVAGRIERRVVNQLDEENKSKVRFR
jgi:hypothetical protein